MKLLHSSLSVLGLTLAVACWLPCADAVEKKNHVIIGDSLSQSYTAWFRFYYPLYPESWDTRSWPEILDDKRGEWFQFVSFDNNEAVPTAKAADWAGWLTDNGWEDWLFRNTYMNPALNDADRVVIFIGGNDIDNAYPGLYEGTSNANAIRNALQGNIEVVANYVKDYATDNNLDIEIVLVAVPHVGVTPNVQSAHPTDPVKTARVTSVLDRLNADLKATAAANGWAFADIYSDTLELLKDEPFYVGGVEIIKAADNDARPQYLFTGDGFHPGEMAQTLFANRILEAINETFGDGIPLFTQSEAVETTGLTFVDHFLDWHIGHGLATAALLDDDDSDGAPNVMEFGLDLNPALPDAGSLPKPRLVSEGGQQWFDLTWRPNASTGGQASIHAESSVNMTDWLRVPDEDIVDNGDGTFSARIPVGDGIGFLRLDVEFDRETL